MHLIRSWLHALSDPQRRKQVFATAVLERWLPTFGVFWSFVGVWTAAWASAVAVLLQFLCFEVVYEYVLRSWFGPYWERTPAEGTTYAIW